MATFKTGAVPSTYLVENRSSWNHATNIGRLRWQFASRDAFVRFPTGQGWWAQRSNADGDRWIRQIDLEEDRIRLDIRSAGGNAGADLSDNWETKGAIGIVANGRTYRYDTLSIDRTDAYNLQISANFQGAWQTFLENHILTRNPYRDARDVRGVDFWFWDGVGTSPFTVALPDAEAPAVGVNAVPATNEETTVQVSATEVGGVYDSIVRRWTAAKGTIVQDDNNPLLAQWTTPNITQATEDFNITYSVTVIGTGTKAKDLTTDRAAASHSATVKNVLSAATAPDTVIIDVANLVTQDAGHTVKLTATVTGGTYDDLQYQWRVKHNGYIPQRDLSDTALDGTDLASPTLTYPAPPSTSATSEIEVELTVTAVGDGTLADNGTTAVQSATAVTFTTWHPVALPDWATPTPLGVLDSDDVHLSSAQEGADVRLFAIRKGGTGRFDDAEIDWEWSHEVDDSNNRVWINLDDEVEDDPFAWTLPSVDVDTPSIIRARFKVLGQGTNARNGTETGWSAWREIAFTILTFHVKAPSTVILAMTHNSGPKAGETGTVFEAGSTARLTAVYDTDGSWDDRDFVWGYIHNDSAVTNAATSAVATSAIITMPNPTESSGDWTIWMYLEVTYKGTGAKARSGTTVTETYYIKGITVRYPRPEVVLPDTLIIVSDGTSGIADGNEGTSVTIGISINGGKYDSYTQEWSVLRGSTNIWGGDDSTAEITWKRPRVSGDFTYVVTCRVLFKGDGTTAKAGSEMVREVSANAKVLNVIVTGIHLGLLAAEAVYVGDIPATAVYIGDKLVRDFS